MSCIYNRAGFYYYRGFGQRFSLKTRDRKEAQKLKKEYDRRFSVEEARGDTIHKPKRVLFKDAMDEYLRYKKQNFAVRTYQTDKQRLGWILDYNGNIPLTRISTDSIIDYVEARQEVVKRSTVRIDLICWKAFLSYCVKRKYIRENPFVFYPIERGKARLVYLSLKEIKQLQAYEDPARPWLNKLINLALLTGFRRNELATLAWENISKNTIIVVGKTGKREFPNSLKIQEILDKIPRVSCWVFSVHRYPKKHLDPDTITLAVKGAFVNLKFSSNYSLHTLRHTFASHLALQGVPIQQIGLLLGHKDLQTTLIYAHLLPKDCTIKLPY